MVSRITGGGEGGGVTPGAFMSHTCLTGIVLVLVRGYRVTGGAGCLSSSTLASPSCESFSSCERCGATRCFSYSGGETRGVGTSRGDCASLLLQRCVSASCPCCVSASCPCSRPRPRPRNGCGPAVCVPWQSSEQRACELEAADTASVARLVRRLRSCVVSTRGRRVGVCRPCRASLVSAAPC